MDYIDDQKLNEAGITREELKRIRDDFEQKIPQYESAAQSVTQILLKTPGVHSVRYRIKDLDGLIKKVVRKRIENKNRIITVDTYEKELNDLAGVRVIHLFKKDWKPIHDFITENWDLEEKPTAYYRGGDSHEILNTFTDQKCEIREHTSGYRSVHYIIQTSTTKNKTLIEVQVRTIFEEGWSEVDHKIRYPDLSTNILTNNLLGLLNRLAGNADEITGYIQALHSYIINSEQEQTEKDKQINELKNIINNSKISKEDKTTLENVAESLSRSRNVHQDTISSFDLFSNQKTQHPRDIYEPLANLLKYQLPQSTTTFTTTIPEIEKLINYSLPEAALTQLSWWTDYSTHSRQWLLTGWSVSHVNQITQEVSFYRWSQYIDTTDQEQIKKWASKYNVSETYLLKVIELTGPLSTVVEDYIKSNNQNQI